ncbi:hypothetical protein D9M68_837540 [compost metagenome]
MIGRIPLFAVLVASLALAGQASAHGYNRDAAIAGVIVGAVIGGVIGANTRYAPAPVYVEIGPPPPVVYYERYPVYRPYPVVVEPYYQYRPHHPKYRHHKHHRHHRGYYAPRW